MRTSRRVVIQPVGFEAPVAVAAAELARYLPQLAPVAVEVLPPREAAPKESKAQIVLGTSFHLLLGLGLRNLPAPSAWDDAFAIIPKAGVLYLAGSNPRSVLFAAYRLLEALGAVFLRPGRNGEVLPKRKALRLPQRPIREKASYRHRGICIEGSPRLEHVLDILDWMAKRRMNAFQLQFVHSGVFWKRGYQQSPEVEGTVWGEWMPKWDSEALDDRVIARAKELGMMIHRVGHGWTAATVGLDGTSWEKTEQRPPASKRQWLAEVNGKRRLWGEVPANTELCYSNPEVRAAFVETVMRYARQHSEVDLLHVWLSDAYNNKCECAGCRAKSPSDWYVELVNAIGQRLKDEGLPMRIVFLGYVDLLWPPQQARLTADNVTFMYAPITRCFRHALDDAKCDAGESAARPALNECRLPRTNRAYAEVMREWTKLGPKDTFLFDYHNIWVVWQDGLGFDVAEVMAQDMADLAGLGLDGFMSCQAIRAFYPTPYLAMAMADGLWNRRLPRKQHRRAVMEAAFGEQAALVEEYLGQLVKMVRLGKDYEHDSRLQPGRGSREELTAVARFAARHQQQFAKLAKSATSEVIRTSLEIMAVHADHAARLARARIAANEGDKKALEKMRAEYEAYLPGVLARYAPWVDPLIGRAMMQVLGEG
jgi:hypothetical protein